MTENEIREEKLFPWLRKKGYFCWQVDTYPLPDVYASLQHQVLWFEIKVVTSVPREGILKPKWRPGQLSWIRKNMRVGSDIVNLVLHYEPENRTKIFTDCKDTYTLKEWESNDGCI